MWLAAPVRAMEECGISPRVIVATEKEELLAVVLAVARVSLSLSTAGALTKSVPIAPV